DYPRAAHRDGGQREGESPPTFPPENRHGRSHCCCPPLASGPKVTRAEVGKPSPDGIGDGSTLGGREVVLHLANRPVFRYGLAFGAAGIATWSRAAIEPTLGTVPTLILVATAIAVVSRLGGIGPGVWAAPLGGPGPPQGTPPPPPPVLPAPPPP